MDVNASNAESFAQSWVACALDFLAFILMIENGWAFCTNLGFFF